MQKFLAILGLSATLTLSSPSSGNALTPDNDPFVRPPYPQASIFAVLMPDRGQCRITLLRDGAIDVPFPGHPTSRIQNLVYLIIGTEAHLKNGDSLPLTFYFANTSFPSLAMASEGLPLRCKELSHLEVLTASCRPQGYDFEENNLLTATLETCVPDLPRRLNFFAVMSGEAIAPRSGE